MKKNRSVLLGIISLLVVLVLAAGCYRPAAPDVTETATGEEEAAAPGEALPDIEATAIARSTQSAATMAAEMPAEEGEGAEEAPEAPAEAAATATVEPTTPAAVGQSPVATSVPVATPVPTMVSVATPVPTSLPPTAVAVPATGATTHIVQPGENMFRIALRYGTTVESIAQANGIANPRMVYVGQQLTIPSTSEQPAQPSPTATTYVVQPGDNLFRIALRYNLSYMQLAQYNGIANPSSIYVGQVIKIPAQ